MLGRQLDPARAPTSSRRLGIPLAAIQRRQSLRLSPKALYRPGRGVLQMLMAVPLYSPPFPQLDSPSAR